MKIFGSEVHDTALVFVACVIVECAVGGMVYGATPDGTFSKLVMYFAAIFTLLYWMAAYSKDHFKDDNENT